MMHIKKPHHLTKVMKSIDAAYFTEAESKLFSQLNAISFIGEEILQISDDMNAPEAKDVSFRSGVILNLISTAIEILNLIRRDTVSFSSVDSDIHHSPIEGASFHQDNPDSSTIGSRIHKLRKARGLTLKDIAESCNVTQQAVHLWESKGAIPSCDKLIPLAKALGCDPLWLINSN